MKGATQFNLFAFYIVCYFISEMMGRKMILSFAGDGKNNWWRSKKSWKVC